MAKKQISEDRKTGNPDYKYVSTGKTKGKTAAGEFSKVTATVSGKSSAALTRLAKKFNEINQLNKRIKILRDDANQEAKDQIAEVFDAEDAAYTRYIDTVSLGISMSKDIEQTDVDVIDVDQASFINELFDVVDAELLPVISDLLKKHTKITRKIKVAQQGRLTVKLPEGVLNESVWSVISKLSKKIYKMTLGRLRRYDAKLDDIKVRYANNDV